MATTLYGVAGASTTLADGTVVEASTNGSSTLTLTAAGLPPSIATTTIATVWLGTSATYPAVPAGLTAIALTALDNADGSAEVFLLGQRGGSTSSLIVIHFRRSRTGAWSEVARRSGALPASTSAIVSLAAAPAPADRWNGLTTLLVIGRRAAPRNADGVFFVTVDPLAIADVARPLFITSGTAPSWLPPLEPTSAELPPVGITRAGKLLPILVDQEAVVEVNNGVVSSRWRPRVTVAQYAADQARIVATGEGSFVVIYGPGSGKSLQVVVRGVTGTLLARRDLVLIDVQGGANGAKWDATYNAAARELLLYYVASPGRTVKRIALSMTTLIASAAETVTTTAGTGGTMSVLRVPREALDERRIRIALAQTISTAETTQYVLDASRNLAPLAPSLVAPSAAIDAVNPIRLSWIFGDPNPRDTQQHVHIEVQRVSDGAVVYGDSVTPLAGSDQYQIVPGGRLVNGVAYRFRVRARDQLGALGAWSTYSANFTPQSAGTVTITSPAADNPTGLDVATVPIYWTADIPSTSPTGWQIRVYDDSTGALLHSAGSTTSYRSNYLAPVPSGVRVRIEVWVTSSAGTTPAARRYLTSTYTSPMPALVTVEPHPSGAGLRLQWAVPAISGSRPTTTSWLLERQTIDGDDFAPAYAIETPGGLPAGTELYLDDFEVIGGVEYIYRLVAIADSGARGYDQGSEVEAVAPMLFGVWMHRTIDPGGTLQAFPYASSRKVDRGVESEAVGIVGRAEPVVEFGDVELADLSMTVRVPHGLGDDAQVAWWRDSLRARGTLVYRDNRQRLVYCALQGITETDVIDGTLVSVTLVRVPFERTPANAIA